MLRLTIETDNDAFADGNLSHELARILRECASRLQESGGSTHRWESTVRDVNGNACGRLVVTP